MNIHKVNTLKSDKNFYLTNIFVKILNLPIIKCCILVRDICISTSCSSHQNDPKSTMKNSLNIETRSDMASSAAVSSVVF